MRAATLLDTQIATKAWENQTAMQARATFRLFIDICGDRPLSTYTRQDAGHLEDQLHRLPQNYGKAAVYRDLTTAQIITRHESQPTSARQPQITSKTIKRHFSALSALWTSAEQRGEVAANIFTGFKFGAVKRAVDQRRMWERTELTKLFATPVWSGCQGPDRRTTPGREILRDEKFWLPLIAVFSGMHQEEICQLRIEDIRQSDGI